jgi:hypothetical protein
LLALVWPSPTPQLVKGLGVGEFLLNRVTAPIGLPPCMSYPMNPACTIALNALFYGPSEFMPTDDFWLIATTWPSSVTTRNLEQWAQVRAQGLGCVLLGDGGAGLACMVSLCPNLQHLVLSTHQQ